MRRVNRISEIKLSIVLRCDRVQYSTTVLTNYKTIYFWPEYEEIIAEVSVLTTNMKMNTD